jgi:predicted phage-related endonuclease
MSDITPRPTVGSSDVAAILGLSPWTTPAEVWARLVGLVPRYTSGDTPATRRGRIMEAALLAEYERLHGVTITPGPSIDEGGLSVPWGDWAHIRPDGVGSHGRAVEVKTTQGFGPEWADELEGKVGDGLVPVYYETQIAWQGAGLGMPVDLIAMAMRSDEIRDYRLERDLAIERELIEAVRDWMTRHVWCDPPVPPEGAEPRVLALVHNRPTREWAEHTEEDLDLAADLRRLKAERERIEALEVRLKGQLCARIGNAYGLRGVARWNPVKGRETVSVSRLRKEHPEVYAALVKVGQPTRAFHLLEER